MNEKLRKHADVLFAAAPKTKRAAEMKEELLANLNERYDDLLRDGYDTTTAFHIALSGIGDIDELFQEFENERKLFPPQENSLPPNPENNALPVPGNTGNSSRTSCAPLFIAIIIALIILPLGFPVFSEIFFPRGEIAVPLMFVCWAVAAGMIAFNIARSCLKSGRSTECAATDFPGITPEEITQKRILAGIFAIFFGTLGVHKFYLGFIGSGLIMLLITVCSVFVLSPLTGMISMIEGIIYLAKSDRDFYNDYILHRRNWF